MKRTIIVLLTALFLFGCSRETQIWLPEEEVVELQGKDVVRIPVGSETEPSAQPQAVPTEEPEPAPTQPVETEKATITKKPTTTPKKNTSTSTTTKKDTITGTGKPAATEPTATKPAATEPPVTIPIITEPTVTEPAATEPVVTEPITTEPAVTEPPVTEPAVTEPPVTEPPATEPPLYDISGYQPGNLEYELLDRVNEHREEAELEPLWMDTWLCAIASCRSFEASQVWSHTRPDGRHFATVLDDYGYSAAAVQELMVYDTDSCDAVTIADRWMESKPHRELLLGDYTTAGVGVYRMDGITYVTCLLAK